MAECSLDLIFLNKRQTFCWGGGGGGAGIDFFQQLNIDIFYRQSESIFCVIHLILPLYTC